MKTIAQMQAENFDLVLRDGPRLRYDYNIWVEAKNTKNNRVLIGGLGSMGVGMMWLPMSERHKELPDFDDAPEMDAPPPIIYCEKETEL